MKQKDKRPSTPTKKPIYPYRQTRADRATMRRSQLRISNDPEADNDNDKLIQSPVKDSEFKQLSEIVLLGKEQRSPFDIGIIVKYLKETELINKFRNEIEMSEDSVTNIMFLCACNLQILSMFKNQILFRIDDTADKFYILLKGTVTVLKPVENEPKKMFPWEFWDHLQLLRDMKESYLLNKTIRANLESCPFRKKKELDETANFVFKFKFNEQSKYFLHYDQAEKFFDDNMRTYEEFNIDSEEVRELYEMNNKEGRTAKIKKEEEETKGAWLAYMNEKLKTSPEEQSNYQKYSHFIDEKEKAFFTTFTYSKFMYLHAGQYFGDFALDNLDKKRTATIRAEDDCILAVISNEIYQEYIRAEKVKVKSKEILFVNENFFFSSIKQSNFAKRYFPNFSSHEYYKGHILYKEGNTADSLVMIKEGLIELSFNGSLIELHNLIKLLLLKFYESQKNTYMPLEDKADFSYFSEFLNDDLITKLRNKSNQYIKDISEKKVIHISLLSAKDMCGLEEIFLGNLNHVCRATVCSEKAKVYKIEVERLKSIFGNEKNCGMIYFKTSYSKIISLIKRFYHIRKTMTSWHLNESQIIDKEREDKITQSKKEDKLFHEGMNGIKILNQVVNKNRTVLEYNNKSNNSTKSIISQRKVNTLGGKNVIADSKNKRISSLFQGMVESASNNDTSKPRSKDNDTSKSRSKDKDKEYYKKFLQIFKIEQIIEKIDKKKKGDLQFDSLILTKVKSSMKKFESESILSNLKSKELKVYDVLRSHKKNNSESFFVTGSKFHNNNRSTTCSVSNFNCTTVEVRDPTKISYLNLFDYEKSDKNLNNNQEENSASIAVEPTPFKIRTNLKLSHRKYQSETNLNIHANDDYMSSLNYIPSAASLPIINKYKSQIDAIHKKSEEKKKKYEDLYKMMKAFDHNLNKGKNKFTVMSVREFHKEYKTKGYSKILSQNNSLLKMQNKKRGKSK